MEQFEMDELELEKKIKTIVGFHLGVYAGDVRLTDNFVDDLGADSLDLVEMVMELEDEFEFEISDDEAEQMQTPQHAIDYVKAYRARTSIENFITAPKVEVPAGTCGNPKCEECEGFDLNYKPEFKRELRLYGFVNHYLANGIQAGIQHGHAAVRLMRNYQCFSGEPSEQTKMVQDWADSHETFIILNGGMHVQMLEVKRLVEQSGYPFAVFHESKEALDGVMTAIVCLLPDDIFNLRKQTNVHGQPYFGWSRKTDDGGTIIYMSKPGDEDYDFIEMLKSKNMATP